MVVVADPCVVNLARCKSMAASRKMVVFPVDMHNPNWMGNNSIFETVQTISGNDNRWIYIRFDKCFSVTNPADAFCVRFILLTDASSENDDCGWITSMHETFLITNLMNRLWKNTSLVKIAYKEGTNVRSQFRFVLRKKGSNTSILLDQKHQHNCRSMQISLGTFEKNASKNSLKIRNVS